MTETAYHANLRASLPNGAWYWMHDQHQTLLRCPRGHHQVLEQTPDTRGRTPEPVTCPECPISDQLALESWYTRRTPTPVTTGTRAGSARQT